MALKKSWHFAVPSEISLVHQLSKKFQLSSLVASILIRRGYSSEESVQSFLYPQLSELRDPYEMRNMKEGVDMLKQAILSQNRIVILGDYDVDGITATAMAMMFLKSCGSQNCDYFIPNRFEHGYGLTQASAEVLKKMNPELVITVDNGITASEEVQYLHQNGIKTLITDHHLAETSLIPDGIVINPNHPECNYPFKGISGCGVVLKLLMAMRKAFREIDFWSDKRPEPNLKSYLDLTALGTVADVVPLIDENRLLVHHGLKVMNSHPRFGIQALSQLKNVSLIDSQTLGFQFGPLLNAAGRMQNASLGVELLLCQELETAKTIAGHLNQANIERRETESQMMEIAVEKAASLQHKYGLVIQSPHFHEGIIGIIAARLVERFYKPALVCAKNGNHYKCSARSIPGFHIKEALQKCADSLEKYGGHAGAAGCTLEHSRFNEFVESFETACREQIPSISQAQVTIEETLPIESIDWNLIEQLEQLQPFGEANPIPLFSIPAPQQSFQILKDKHIKWNIPGKEIIGWNLAESFSDSIPKTLAVELGINEFMGQRKIQMIIQEYQ
ncbi:MAG: single-stranded-DNA-specific exonuclease RecJ [SAR324 cluster bacterium]|nr:single-stranded-DNA-specific exonuclease RecJ [SAR324 cluster bacterium]